jgi:hypothetical protein
MALKQILPTWLALNACNFTSPTAMADPVTGAPYYGGALNVGDFFDCTEQEANTMSYATTGTCHAGRYRFIQVDSGATTGNVKTGTIGYMLAGGQPNLNLVTSYDKSIIGAHPVVFLNSITPGNYGFVQEIMGGVATVLCGTSLTKSGPATGDIINATTLGVVDDPTSQTYVPSTIGIALDPPNPSTLIRLFCYGVPGMG